MGLPEIVKRIQDEANIESERYMTEAKDQIAKMKEVSDRELKDQMDEMGRKHEKDRKALWNMYISDGKRRSRHAILCAKEELIWEAMSAFRTRLRDMKGPELSLRLLPLVAEARSALGEEMTIFPVRSEDSAVLKGKAVIGLTIEGERDLPQALQRFQGKDLIGGFVAVSSDGSRVMDLTFQGILEKSEDKVREEIARVLFEE